jgi:Ca2+/Na+ antiporter
MLKGLTRVILLTVQARSGGSPAMFVWAAVMVLASLTAFIFLCVTLYEWLSLQLGGIVAGLVVASIFILIAAIGAIICALVRRRVRERAIVERAALATSPSWLLDPKLLAPALQAGRALGWQRIVPIVLLGFMATQLTRGQPRRRTK